jgi:hypothetical protein
MQYKLNPTGRFNGLFCCSKITSFIILSLFTIAAHAQTSAEFASAQEAIDWAYTNKTTAANITHIVITGNNNKADLLKLKTLNNNSGSGLFRTLQSIELAAQKDTLPNSCFYANYTGTQWLKSFSAPNLTGVGSWAFRFCSALSSVELPAVTYIGAYAFYNCGFTAIHLPATLTQLDANPFLGCKDLKNITIDATNNHFTTEDGILFNIDKTLLIVYPLGKEAATFTSPNTVVTVGNNAFGTCSGLTTLELPAVNRVDNWVCEFCTGLTSVKFDVQGVIDFGSDVFSGVTTKSIDLYLNALGEEYTNNVSGTSWKGYDWKSINKELSAYNQEIASDKDLSLRLYPNPVHDVLRVESTEKVSTVSVYDLNAKIVLQTNNIERGINLSKLPSATYVVKITSDSGMKEERVFIKK